MKTIVTQTDMQDKSSDDRKTQMIERIDRDFTYIPPTDDSVSSIRMVRNTAKVLARMMTNECPQSRELSLAITSLEEAVMWFNAAVVRNQDADD